jgi:rhamnulokinase
MHKFLAFDLGASSGRGIIGTLENDKISLKEVHRFYNGMTRILGSSYWDIFRLYEEIKTGMVKATQMKEIPETIGFDTWGVDYALLDKDGQFLGMPYAYRDERTDGAMEEFFKILPADRIYEMTGIQFMQLNTLFQLYAAKRDRLSVMDLAHDLLFVPDIFNYLLTGVKKSEFSFATTTQLYNPREQKWEKELFDALGISVDIMQEIVSSGTVVGKLTPEIMEETHMPEVEIIASVSHDTGAAIASIPAKDSNFAYISSGTWSLMGIESEVPIITERSRELNFTNEGGVDHTFRVLKNIMGLWLIQECRKEWLREGKDYSFPELVEMAATEQAFEFIINPDDKSFLNPANMPQTIADYCKKNNLKVPQTAGQFARCIFDSLALKYRQTLEGLKEISGKRIEIIHIIGGGSQNQLLCQLTANATGLPVVAGPAEGTALGNIMVQAQAKGYVNGLTQIREVIKNSFEFKEYIPSDTEKWEEAYNNNYLKLF